MLLTGFEPVTLVSKTNVLTDYTIRAYPRWDSNPQSTD